MPAWLERTVQFLLSPRHLMALGVVSFVLFVVSVVALPWLIVRMPADYFSVERDRRSLPGLSGKHPALYVLRNLLGLVLLVCGIAMLFLPGQGLLVIVLSIMCLDFPRKRAVERYIVSRRAVLRAFNAIRRRAGRPPLDLGTEAGYTADDQR
jgi:hypothetical protein